jgi:hypothetical protein
MHRLLISVAIMISLLAVTTLADRTIQISVPDGWDNLPASFKAGIISEEPINFIVNSTTNNWTIFKNMFTDIVPLNILFDLIGTMVFSVSSAVYNGTIPLWVCFPLVIFLYAFITHILWFILRQFIKIISWFVINTMACIIKATMYLVLTPITFWLRIVCDSCSAMIPIVKNIIKIASILLRLMAICISVHMIVYMFKIDTNCYDIDCIANNVIIMSVVALTIAGTGVMVMIQRPVFPNNQKNKANKDKNKSNKDKKV